MFDDNSINRHDEPVGLLKSGTISSPGYNPRTGTIKVQLNTAVMIKGQQRLEIDVPVPQTLSYNNGLFIGAIPAVGTPVVVGLGSGSQYYFVSFGAENSQLPPTNLSAGSLLIKTNDDTRITLNTKNSITLGSPTNQIHINTGSIDKPNTNLLSMNLDNQFRFTQAYREIGGVVKRDLQVNTRGFDASSKLEDDSYDSVYKIIGLDPIFPANNAISGPLKNPPLVEHRELIYEFQHQSNVKDDLAEAALYSATSTASPSSLNVINRRQSRADTLSLTLAEPNYLIETIKGTVVDIFGNILDLNRVPLPAGKEKSSLSPDQGTDKRAVYLKLKEMERKSIAYHFELNARKDFGRAAQASTSAAQLLNINSNDDYARIRSRFFLDIDKEGQFKLNVPASSEKGNVPLLLRYENYSTFGKENNGNPNTLIVRKDNKDILHDSFAAQQMTFAGAGFNSSKYRGSIELKDGGSEGAPPDRITQTVIKHGTAHHDVLQTCFVHQNNRYIDYQVYTGADRTVNIDRIPPLKDIASPVIRLSGDDPPDKGGANAGGRSGSMNLDGSLDLSIGANTIDRQSLWLDLAGGMIMNVGRDLKKRSALVSMGGDFFLQIGGFGVAGDSRFIKENDTMTGAVLDLRILTSGGYCHLIRCDNDGISIMSPGNIAIHAKQKLKLTGQDVSIEAATLQLNKRMVLKIGPSI